MKLVLGVWWVRVLGIVDPSWARTRKLSDTVRLGYLLHIYLVEENSYFDLPFYRSRVVRKAWEADKISEKWAESAWAKRMEQKRRRQGLNDFDRFKLMKAKSARNKILAKAVNIKKNKLTKAGKL